MNREAVLSIPSTENVEATDIYMGVNADSSNHLLPTTRLVRAVKRALGAKPDVAGPRDPSRVEAPPRGAARRLAAGLWSMLRLTNRLADQWYRQVVSWSYQLRGYVVIYDRHYFSDYYDYDIAPGNRPRSLAQRIHGFVLRRIYPRPSLVICLDAPGEVLFSRKGEGTVELLELRRRQYLQMRPRVKHFAVVDASQSEGEVVTQVAERIVAFHDARRGRSEANCHAAD